MVTIAKLPAKTEAEIRYLIEAGGYNDAADVVIQTVHEVAQREKALAALRAKIHVGLDQAERGELIDDSPEFRRQLRKDAHELAVSGLPLDPDV